MYDQDMSFIAVSVFLHKKLQSIRTLGSLCKVTCSCAYWKQSPPVPSGAWKHRKKSYLVLSHFSSSRTETYSFLQAPMA